MEERRLLLAVVLSIAVLMAWQFLFPPPKHKPKVSPQVQQAQKEKPKAAQRAESRPTPRPGEEHAAGRPRGVEAPEKKAVEVKSADLEPAQMHERKDVVVETDLYRCVLTTAGGGIKMFKLKKFRVEPDKNSPLVTMVEPTLPETKLPLTTDLSIGGKLLSPSVVFTAGAKSLDLSSPNSPEKGVVTMSVVTSGGIKVVRKYTFERDSYKIGLEIQVGKSSIGTGEETAAQTPVPVELTLHWNTPISKKEAKSRFTFYGMVAHGGGKYIKKRVSKLRKKGPFEYQDTDWAGFASGYFLSVIVPVGNAGRRLFARVESVGGEEVVDEALSFAAGVLKAGQPYRVSTVVYVGPKDHRRLSMMGKQLDEAIGYGRLKWIILPLMWILRLFDRLVHNWGLAIILLTVFIKILFYPLTRKSYQQMKAMQALQPRIKEIQKKYKDDREKMNAEMMALYRVHKVNPVGGCLPMLLQLPVLYALYRALYVSIELRHAPFIWWINDLSGPEKLFVVPIMGGTGIGIMPLLMGASMYVQQKMTPTTTADPTQAKMFMAMPIIFTVISFGFPSGLVLYWFVSNLLTIIQQYIINRRGT